MPLSNDFLRQARRLAGLDSRRPLQINLRRSVSAAYYSLFHLFTDELVSSMVPGNPSALRSRVGRALQHAEMKEVCMDFKKAQTPPKLLAVIGGPISPELREIANAFIQLQQQRHSADYDPGFKLSRSTVLDSVSSAELVFASWKVLRGGDEANVFLAALAFGKRWDR
jgi:uncharacterized protein (UPF0332 family)